MNEPAIKFTLDVTADSESVLSKWAVKFLTDLGYDVAAPNAKWESVGDFKTRLSISYGTVANKVRETPRRPNVLIQRGAKNKQILAILSNPAFDAYCVKKQ